MTPNRLTPGHVARRKNRDDAGMGGDIVREIAEREIRVRVRRAHRPGEQRVLGPIVGAVDLGARQFLRAVDARQALADRIA